MIGHSKEYPKMQDYLVNDTTYNFDWVLMGIPVQNCIVGMLLTCPIE